MKEVRGRKQKTRPYCCSNEDSGLPVGNHEHRDAASYHDGKPTGTYPRPPFGTVWSIDLTSARRGIDSNLELSPGEATTDGGAKPLGGVLNEQALWKVEELETENSGLRNMLVDLQVCVCVCACTWECVHFWAHVCASGWGGGGGGRVVSV